MDISVVIPTWNRSFELAQTLEAMTHLRVPEGLEWELIVVDNNSTDDTEQVLASFADRLPIRRVLETKQGAAAARNAGVRATRGDVIVFTDDDVFVDRDWLGAYWAASTTWPDALYFGGPIHPRFGEGVPRWVRDNPAQVHTMLAMRELGPEERAFVGDESPWGPNMALRRAAFGHGYFDESVGRIAESQMRGDEMSLLITLQEQNALGVWVPAARVEHFIPHERACLKYYLVYYFCQGRNETEPTGNTLWSFMPRWALWNLGIKAIAGIANFCLRRPAWVGQIALAVYASGCVVETARIGVRRAFRRTTATD